MPRLTILTRDRMPWKGYLTTRNWMYSGSVLRQFLIGVVLEMPQKPNRRERVSLTVSASGKMHIADQVEYNTDALLVKESYFQSVEDAGGLRFYAVMDGMGSNTTLGEAASLLVLRTLDQQIQASSASSDRNIPDVLREVFMDAHGRICEYARENLRSEEQYIGSALVAAIIHDNTLYVANVGGCRAYLIRSEAIEQLTIDHTYLQRLIDEGLITKEEVARNRDLPRHLYSYLGNENLAELVGVYPPVSLSLGDKILLCSDGLTDVVGDETILNITGEAETEQYTCEELLQCASDNNTDDCAAVILLTIGGND